MSIPTTVLDGINPLWRLWYLAQISGTQSGLGTYWDSTATDATVASGHRHENYARKSLLIAYATSNYGY